MEISEVIKGIEFFTIESAADYYEKIIASDHASLNLLLNAALFYWQATDPGNAAENKLSGDFMAFAEQRSRELLNEAEKYFPQSTEVRFWKKYIPWADLGEDFDKVECRKLLEEDPSVLTPALYLYMNSKGQEFQKEAKQLCLDLKNKQNARAHYISSVLKFT